MRCLFLLAEEGKLSVNDPVAKYYPDLTRAKDITLLDLMNHTSGYPDYYPLDFLDRRMLKPIPFEKMLTDYAKVKLDFEPGSKFSYSNTGYMILGGIIEKVSGESLGKFMERRILKPLKMEHSQYASTKGLPSVAQGYTSFAIGAPEKSIYEADGWIEAAGGLWASASDLLRWDLALVTGKVLKPESYKLMTSIRPLSTGKISDYGCGLGIGFTKGDMVLQHTGGVSGFVSYNAMLPGKKSAVVLLSNAEHVSPGPVRNLIFNLLVKEVQKNDDPAVPKIAGPAPKEAVLAFLKEMQSGKLDREKLGEEFSFYLNPERVQGASERLKKLGDPESVDVGGTSERGGMEVANVKLKFKTATLRASMYRTPDGKIQQLLFYNE